MSVELTEAMAIEKIRKLQARIADDVTTESESEIAAKHIARLMMKHAISQSQLEVKEKIVQLTEEIGRSNWLRYLLFYVAEFCSCSAVIQTGTRYMILTGYHSDVENAHYLFDMIRVQIENANAKFMEFNFGKKISNDFKMSAIKGVKEQLNGIKFAASQESSSGTELVLSRKSEVDNFVRSGMKIGKTTMVTYSANDAGLTAGRNVQISKGISSAGMPRGIGMPAKQLKG